MKTKIQLKILTIDYDTVIGHSEIQKQNKYVLLKPQSYLALVTDYLKIPSEHSVISRNVFAPRDYISLPTLKKADQPKPQNVPPRPHKEMVQTDWINILSWAKIQSR